MLGNACALLLVAAVMFVGVPGGAQEDKAAFTLHAYADLMQVPVLVLASEMGPMRHPVDPGRFVVSLDSGKKFAPTSVKLEGDDPLELAIVLDVSGSQKELAESFPAVGAEFAATMLRPQDHVSVYALACGHLLKSADGIKPDPQAVKQALEVVLQSPKVVERLNGAPCESRILLWSGLLSVVKELQGSAGRRSMLVVSDGEDRGSEITWKDLHDVAGVHGVALFGMSSGRKHALQGVDEMGRPLHIPDRFQALCESTGGIVLPASPLTVGKELGQWVTLLRGRYILEFPRPQQMGSGMHSIVVSIRGEPGAFVTEAGVQVKIPDAAQMADPHRVHSDAGAEIPVGNRKPLVDGQH